MSIRHVKSVFLLGLLILVFLKFIPSHSAGIFLKSANFSCYPKYADNCDLLIIRNPKDEFNWTVNALIRFKTDFRVVKVRIQVFAKMLKFFDQSVDVCALFERKRSSNVIDGYMERVVKAVKGIELKCPLKAVR